MTDVCLLALPYAAVERPSLALGILQRQLADGGLASRVRYVNFMFAERIGLANYYFLGNSAPQRLMAEWTFAGAAFDGLPAAAPDPAPFLRECQARGIGPDLLRKIRASAADFVEAVVDRLLEDEPRIVGCSSVFQQHCASLAVLRRLKERRPEVVTLLGGSNCDGPMGQATHASFAWVDFVVSGEADLYLPELCRAILDRGPELPPEELPEGVYGPALRGRPRRLPARARPVVQDLDALPAPAYDDYFEALAASPLADSIRPTLLFEASRGCWWGQTNQCTFCGLDGDMAYRSKSAERVLSELSSLRRRHGLNRFMATDLILNRAAFETVLPRLAREPERSILFFETSANLTRAQVGQLAAAGVRWIQPGIESLHDGILRLLKKGTCSWKNVQLLKWCLQHGISVAWNWLAGVPGEELGWYHEALAWLPLVEHLQPPSSLSLVRYDRFSPYHAAPEQHGLQLEPARAYAQVYPLPAERLRDLANYFDDVGPAAERRSRAGRDVFASLSTSIQAWQARFYDSRPDIVRRVVSADRPVLDMSVAAGRVTIRDTRLCAPAAEVVLEGLEAEAYLACDAAQTPGMLVRQLQQQGHAVTAEAVTSLVETLVARKLALDLGGRILSLAVGEPRHEILPAEDDPEGLVMIPRKGGAPALEDAGAD